MIEARLGRGEKAGGFAELVVRLEDEWRRGMRTAAACRRHRDAQWYADVVAGRLQPGGKRASRSAAVAAL